MIFLNKQTMQALVKTNDKVEIKSVPIPTINPNEVLIKVAFAGVCRTDVYVAQNKIRTKSPLILGHEFSGMVVAVGSGVKTIKNGDYVTAEPFTQDHQYLGLDLDGCFAEYIKLPANIVHVLPKGLDLQTAMIAEPIAAMLAVLKAPINKSDVGVVAGENRIAELVHQVLVHYGFSNVKLMSASALQKFPANSFDFGIETTNQDQLFESLIQSLKTKGVLVLKSRYTESIAVPVGEIVRKEICCFGTYYGDFKEGLELLNDKNFTIKNYWGKSLNLSESLPALMGDGILDEKQKYFLKL